MKKIAIILLLFCAFDSIAEKSTLYVNKYTKELFLAEGDQQPGFLNWEKIPPQKQQEAISIYTEKKFKFTTFPFKEEALFSAVIVLTLGLIFYGIIKRLKR